MNGPPLGRRQRTPAGDVGAGPVGLFGRRSEAAETVDVPSRVLYDPRWHIHGLRSRLAVSCGISQQGPRQIAKEETSPGGARAGVGDDDKRREPGGGAGLLGGACWVVTDKPPATPCWRAGMSAVRVMDTVGNDKTRDSGGPCPLLVTTLR